MVTTISGLPLSTGTSVNAPQPSSGPLRVGNGALEGFGDRKKPFRRLNSQGSVPSSACPHFWGSWVVPQELDLGPNSTCSHWQLAGGGTKNFQGLSWGLCLISSWWPLGAWRVPRPGGPCACTRPRAALPGGSLCTRDASAHRVPVWVLPQAICVSERLMALGVWNPLLASPPPPGAAKIAAPSLPQESSSNSSRVFLALFPPKCFFVGIRAYQYGAG